MKTRFIILIIIAAFGTKGFAQLGTPLSQFSGNQTLYNPAYAGAYEMLAMNLSLRQQWTQFPGAPRIINFNAHSPIQRSRQAVGLVYTRQEWGPLVGNYVYGNYAHRIYVGQGVLKFGLQAGILNRVTNWNLFDEFGVDDPTDITFDPDGTGRSVATKFDAGLGVFFMTENYYVGASAKHITRPKFDHVRINDTNWHSQMPVDWFFMAGYRHHFNDMWSVRPEVLVRYIPTVPVSVNVGMHMYFTNNYSFGANFMTGQRAVSFMAKAMITDNFRVGFSYDVYFGQVQSFQRGSYEIMVNYYIRDILWDRRTNVRRD